MNTNTDINTDITDITDIETPLLNCSICLKDNILQEDKCFTNCDHSFCKGCLDEWFDTGSDACPLCRQTITYFNHNNITNRLVIRGPQINQSNHRQLRRTLVLTRAMVKRFQCFFVVTLIGLVNITNLYYNKVYQNNLLREKYLQCDHNSSDLSHQVKTYEDLLSGCYASYGGVLAQNEALHEELQNDIIHSEDSLFVSIYQNSIFYKCQISLASYNNCFN